jgi:hypothetical protein
VKACLWVFIDARLVSDVFGAIRVSQGAQSLFAVRLAGAHIRNHHSLGVASQRVLQQPRKLAVSVWDVACIPHLNRRYYCRASSTPA